MTTADVARRLGMVLSPAQELYRFHRLNGADKRTARAWAKAGAGALSAARTNVVLAFIREHAVWTIPEDAWPKREGGGT